MPRAGRSARHARQVRLAIGGRGRHSWRGSPEWTCEVGVGKHEASQQGRRRRGSASCTSHGTPMAHGPRSEMTRKSHESGSMALRRPSNAFLRLALPLTVRHSIPPASVLGPQGLDTGADGVHRSPSAHDKHVELSGRRAAQTSPRSCRARAKQASIDPRCSCDSRHPPDTGTPRLATRTRRARAHAKSALRAARALTARRRPVLPSLAGLAADGRASVACCRATSTVFPVRAPPSPRARDRARRRHARCASAPTPTSTCLNSLNTLSGTDTGSPAGSLCR